MKSGYTYIMTNNTRWACRGILAAETIAKDGDAPNLPAPTYTPSVM